MFGALYPNCQDGVSEVAEFSINTIEFLSKLDMSLLPIPLKTNPILTSTSLSNILACSMSSFINTKSLPRLALQTIAKDSK